VIGKSFHIPAKNPQLPNKNRMNRSTLRLRGTALKKFCVTIIPVIIIAAGPPRLSAQEKSSVIAGLRPGAIDFSGAGEGSAAVARGRAAFTKGNLNQLGGNGRSCADCHMPTENFQLSPAAVKERFDALLAARVHNKNADDPLFRPVDADDFRTNGVNANDFSNLVENGLVRVTMPLPTNVKLLDPVTNLPLPQNFVDLWRAVQPIANVAITGPDGVVPIHPPGAPRTAINGLDPNGPNRQGGYQSDARFGSLQEQARGALISHAEVTSEPAQDLLDDLAAFQETLFSSPLVEELALAIRAGATQFPNADPELNALELEGRTVFTRACAQCHGGTLHPSTSTPDATIPRPIVRYHNILSSFPRPPGAFARGPARLARNAQSYQITLANGSTTNITTSDPGRLLLTGQFADLGMMDIPNLRGISKTAPYFHNNSAATLEEMLDHYDAFFLRVASLFPPPALLPPLLSSNGVDVNRGFVLPSERAALLAYLRKI
jgi:cytochrome c peroxidase